MNYFKYVLTFLFSSIIIANYSIHFDYMSGHAESILSSNGNDNLKNSLVSTNS